MPILNYVYFHILIDLSLLPENKVSDFLEYDKQIIVPVCPVRVCTILFDFIYVSHILIVLSADPVITNNWLNIFWDSKHLIYPLWILGKLL